MGYAFWQKIGLFRHGYMDQSGYAIDVINGHLQTVGKQNDLTDEVILELGPGDTVSSALIASVYGGTAVLVDSGDYATKNLSTYHGLVNHLNDQGFSVPDITHANSVEDVLETCDGRYLTEGLNSLKSLDDNSVDLIFSQAVLEHVRKDEFLETMRECKRVLKVDGIASHRIDLKDHLGGGLNNLRFSENLWESNFFVRSGFYTNRIRYYEMISLMEAAGFNVDIVSVSRWDRPPIERQKLHPIFSDLSDDDLLIRGFNVLLRPA